MIDNEMIRSWAESELDYGEKLIWYGKTAENATYKECGKSIGDFLFSLVIMAAGVLAIFAGRWKAGEEDNGIIVGIVFSIIGLRMMLASIGKNKGFYALTDKRMLRFKKNGNIDKSFSFDKKCDIDRYSSDRGIGNIEVGCYIRRKGRNRRVLFMKFVGIEEVEEVYNAVRMVKSYIDGGGVRLVSEDGDTGFREYTPDNDIYEIQSGDDFRNIEASPEFYDTESDAAVRIRAVMEFDEQLIWCEQEAADATKKERGGGGCLPAWLLWVIAIFFAAVPFKGAWADGKLVVPAFIILCLMILPFLAGTVILAIWSKKPRVFVSAITDKRIICANEKKFSYVPLNRIQKDTITVYASERNCGTVNFNVDCVYADGRAVASSSTSDTKLRITFGGVHDPENVSHILETAIDQFRAASRMKKKTMEEEELYQKLSDRSREGGM